MSLAQLSKIGSEKYSINKNDFIYLSQKYRISDHLFSGKVIETLSRIALVNKTRVVMKLHPKESLKTMEVFREAISERLLHDTIILIEENDFLIEPCIAMVKPSAIIGLTSTALAYSTLISKDSSIVSIAPYVLDALGRTVATLDDKPRFISENPGIQELENHLTIIKKFPGIRFISDEDGLELSTREPNNKNMNSPDETRIIHKKIALAFSSCPDIIRLRMAINSSEV